jgi:hypothetical protein
MIPGCTSQIRISDIDFLPILDPGSRGQKAPDPESGSATLNFTSIFPIRNSEYTQIFSALHTPLCNSDDNFFFILSLKNEKSATKSYRNTKRAIILKRWVPLQKVYG